MLHVHQAVLQSNIRHATVITQAFLSLVVSKSSTLSSSVSLILDVCISATQACKQQSTHVAALIQMCRRLEAKQSHATSLEAVSATLHQAAVNRVSGNTAHLQLLQGTLLQYSSHLCLAVHTSCITHLALHLILLLHRLLKKLKLCSCSAEPPRLQLSRKTCSDSWSCKLMTTKKKAHSNMMATAAV